MKHIEPTEIIHSHRILSSHGQDIEYEFLHAIVNWGSDYDRPTEAVLCRMVYQGTPKHRMPPEIPLADLEYFQSEWNIFVQKVLTEWKKRKVIQ